MREHKYYTPILTILRYNGHCEALVVFLMRLKVIKNSFPTKDIDAFTKRMQYKPNSECRKSRFQSINALSSPSPTQGGRDEN